MSALFDVFVHGLSGAVKDQLAPLDLPEDLHAFITLTLKSAWLSAKWRSPWGATFLLGFLWPLLRLWTFFRQPLQHRLLFWFQGVLQKSQCKWDMLPVSFSHEILGGIRFLCEFC